MNKLRLKENPKCNCNEGEQAIHVAVLNCQLRTYDGDLEHFINLEVNSLTGLFNS